MIDHSQCDHPRTSGARAKCRRRQGQGGATPKEVDFTKTRSSGRKGRDTSKTPSQKGDECMICGLEWATMRGTDPLSGILLYVGDTCEYMVRHSPDKEHIS